VAAPLADAADLDLHLQRTIDPDVAALALAGASGLVRSYCGWGLSRETTTFTVTGDDTVILSLPTLYLRSVSAIRIGGLALDPGGPQPVPLQRGQVIWAATWPSTTQVEVDADHGYDDTPDLVRLVVLTLAARIIANPEDAKTASVGTVSRSFDTTLTALDTRLLDIYRI
jgi:hypothetical protein